MKVVGLKRTKVSLPSHQISFSTRKKFGKYFSNFFTVNFTEIYMRKKLWNVFLDFFLCVLGGEKETPG
jgi:hypothetical protein